MPTLEMSAVRLRLHRGSQSVETTVHLDTLTDDIARHGSITPGDELLLANRWIAVADHPGPWIDRLLGLAIEAAVASDVGRVEELADRILAYAGNQGDGEAVCCARFLKALLRSGEGNYPEAVELLEQSLRARSCVTAAAHNNLAVAWIELRNPLAAMKHLLLALAHDPALLVPHISMRELAAQMIGEQAPDLPGRPRWSAVHAQAVGKLRSLSRAEILRFLDPRRPFPGFQVLQVFVRKTCVPRISSGLAGAQTHVPGGEALLSKAEEALAKKRYSEVCLLSQKVARLHPPLAATAAELEAEAGAKLDEAHWLEHAEQYAECLETFLDQLENLSLDDLDAPRESLALLRPHAPDFDALRLLYHERIAKLVTDALRQSPSENQRAYLLELGRRYGVDGQGEGYRQAARIRRASQSLRQFRQALGEGNLEAARTTLERAERLLGNDISDERTILDGLESSEALLRSLVSLEGCLKIAEAMRQIDDGDFQAARESLDELLLTEPNTEEPVRLRKNLSSAEAVGQARQFVRERDWRSATRKLRAAILERPDNRDALVLMLTLELLASKLTGTAMRQAAHQGAAAIDAFLASEADACRRTCDTLAAAVKESWLVPFLRSACDR